jgi:hypothetical protein
VRDFSAEKSTSLGRSPVDADLGGGPLSAAHPSQPRMLRQRVDWTHRQIAQNRRGSAAAGFRFSHPGAVLFHRFSSARRPAARAGRDGRSSEKSAQQIIDFRLFRAAFVGFERVQLGCWPFGVGFDEHRRRPPATPENASRSRVSASPLTADDGRPRLKASSDTRSAPAGPPRSAVCRARALNSSCR